MNKKAFFCTVSPANKVFFVFYSRVMFGACSMAAVYPPQLQLCWLWPAAPPAPDAWSLHAGDGASPQTLSSVLCRELETHTKIFFNIPLETGELLMVYYYYYFQMKGAEKKKSEY